jgi:23S rRNA (guanosine2251-2'-O)-methyltransferase
VTSSRQRNDADHRRKKPFSPGHRGGREGPREGGRGRPFDEAGEWLWGWHAVAAALANPRREEFKRLLATPERGARLRDLRIDLRRVETLDNQAIAQLLPQGAVHQGIAVKIAPLESLSIEELAEPAAGVILMLDQLTDPQNVGAVFRSAAAFGARGIVLQDRHAPNLAGSLAKAAAGAVDLLPHARVVNLSRALERLADLGWRAVGLEGGSSLPLDQALDGGPTVLVLGSEGEGLRRLVAEHCDVLAAIPMPGGFQSLNVSAAAAVALYEASRPRR